MVTWSFGIALFYSTQPKYNCSLIFRNDLSVHVCRWLIPDKLTLIAKKSENGKNSIISIMEKKTNTPAQSLDDVDTCTFSSSPTCLTTAQNRHT